MRLFISYVSDVAHDTAEDRRSSAYPLVRAAHNELQVLKSSHKRIREQTPAIIWGQNFGACVSKVLEANKLNIDDAVTCEVEVIGVVPNVRECRPSLPAAPVPRDARPKLARVGRRR